MKVIIKADSQEEFDTKREKLVETLSGRKALTPRESPLKFQNESFKYWDSRYQKMIASMKSEIAKVLSE